MNGRSDLPLTNGTATAERPCGLTSILPSISMSCKGRAEAFARRLQSKLRTLGSQSSDSPTGDDDPIVGLTNNTWISHENNNAHVTNHQPLKSTSNEADSFFDFDCELESPGSPVEECEYSQLIETASTTPHDFAPESGYICSTPLSATSRGSSHSSSDEPFFDPENSDGDQRSLPTDYFDCDEPKQEIHKSNNCFNGHINNDVNNYHQNDSSDSLSDSLPPSQESTSANLSSLTHSTSPIFDGVTSASNCTLQDIVLNDLHQQSKTLPLQNGHCKEDIEVNNEESASENDKQSDKIEKETLEEKCLTNGYADNTDLNGIESSVSPPPSPSHESQRPLQLEVNNEKKISNNNRKSLDTCDTDDEEDCRPQRVRRCSSLKTGKTPPGTPGRKKIVRFADVLGLDLADVKTFLDEIPTVPKSAYEDLEIIESEPIIQLGPRVEKILMPMFQQPGGLPSFLDIVRDKQVCLENAAVTDPINMTITGSVRVRNLDFHKSVYIRYTLDNWRSYADLQATYVGNSCDGFSDKFSFVIFGNSMLIGQRLEFAVRFHCKGHQYWDNNYGTNYCFHCLPATNPLNIRTTVPINLNPILSPIDTWCGGSFY